MKIMIYRKYAFGKMILNVYTTIKYKKYSKNRDSKAVEECVMKLDCPVIVIDRTLSVIYNLEEVIDNLNQSL